ncbi:hypothetical protein [Natronobacterium gregoryi]|uniref:Uncharacterized protein n=2 Tax=Natronobacterium gregoryi TaxID=44930 RepID=L0ADC9_NATGS|nr:hypothetical protein [Natronobacterium gregoryi]AFZ71918.1 hypothetical protein Natgr_0671 [Natronobacterium gregoryi SP2]ELY62461.1 hypothetical protein C490_17903 [Natronobacterium gregoryi SP2]PLK20698.1 hypothetical protein CYV19_08065 [Natronobacterium gregoryi SP2]SFJ13996.1 hypothetical protein SAMN05443661_11550 [Natronobacterium gregoryi]
MATREYVDSDRRFYYAVGVFVMLVFVGAIAVSSILDLVTIDRRLVPLAVGFFLFLFVYFVSIRVQALEPES